ncbi:Maf family protein [Ruania zhangjianzhongii]|uniref:Maf family protein n=1 Tax=Ruania zhangjianzhongii TaxID=2603206 RepID=UPI0011C81E1C|nr:Maf family protein [Ruania zhangjianzhongii]
MRPRLILASASPARAGLLRGAGVDPIIQVADVDEEALTAAHTAAHGPISVAESVQLLARAKAEKVAAEIFAATEGPTDGGAPLPAAFPADGPTAVLGCDSLLEVDGEALGKPHTPERARERWQRIRGRSGVLHTGHHLITASCEAGATSHTTVDFAEITDAEIEAYIATDEPLEVAGAFTIDGYGGAFIRRIEGDHHGVMGISLPLLRDLLGQVGLTWVDLWRHRPAPGLTHPISVDP